MTVTIPPTRHPDEHTLALGCFASLCRDRLSDPLVTFSQAHPQLTIGVHEMSNPALLSSVRSGALALAVSPADPVADLASVPLWVEQVVALLAPDHPLAGVHAVATAQLTDALFLVTGNELDRFFFSRLFPAPRPALRMVAEERLLRAAVARGEGIALAQAERGSAADEGLVTVPIADAAARIVVRAFWMEERARSGPLCDAVALLRAHAEQHGLA